MLERVLTALNAYPPVVRRIRHAATTFAVAAGDTEWRFALQGGQIVATDADPAFALRIDATAWDAFRQEVPPPGAHDFSAMTETGRATVEGNPLLLFQYNWVLRDVVAALAGKEFGR